MNTLIAEKIQKTYKGNNNKLIYALKESSFEFGSGIYGILGPNGAGKSTLFKLLAGIIEPEQGQISLDNIILKKNVSRYKSYIGYMPQEADPYPDFSVEKFLSYFAHLKGLKGKIGNNEVKKNLEIVQLWEKRHQRISSLSGGMKRRLMLAQALLGSPHLILLDEPTAGLDPAQRISVKNTLSKLDYDPIILISTHVVSDIEHIAGKIIMIKEGQIIMDATASDIISEFKDKTFEAKLPTEYINSVEKDFLISRMQVQSDGMTLVRICGDFQKKPTIKEIVFQSVEPCLEDVYLYIFGRGYNYV